MNTPPRRPSQEKILWTDEPEAELPERSGGNQTEEEDHVVKHEGVRVMSWRYFVRATWHDCMFREEH